MRKKLITLFMALAMMLSMCVCSFAEDSGNTATTPVTGNFDETVIATFDFAVTESVEPDTVGGVVSGTDIAFEDYSVTNNSICSITVDVNLENADWTAKAFDTDWTIEPVNSKTFGLKLNDSVDMFTTVGSTGYNLSSKLEPEANVTVGLVGKLAVQSDDIEDAHLGNLIATVDWF